MQKIPNYLILFLILFIGNSHLIIAQSPDWLWAKSIGGSNQNEKGNSIAIDGSGNIYITGGFEGTVDFDPGAGVYNLISNGHTDIFISKFDSSGNLIWARSFGDTVVDQGNSVAVDSFGNVYTSGNFFGIVDFDPGPATFNLGSPGDVNVFINKLDSMGNLLWAKAFDKSYCDALSLDNFENVYTTGYFGGTVDFNPDTGIFNLTSTGLDIYIHKLDINGNFKWAKKLGGANYDYGKSIANDLFGNVYSTGFFKDTADFDPGPGIFNLIAPVSLINKGIYISKLDSSGNFVFAKSFTGDEFRSTSITVDVFNNFCMTGDFMGIVDFDPDSGVFNLNGYLQPSIFISKYDSLGEFIWAKAIVAGGALNVQAPTTDLNGDIYITGSGATVDANPGLGTFILTGNGYADIIIVKLNQWGNFVWAKNAGGIWIDEASSIALDKNGKVYITGSFSSPSVSFNASTIVNADSTGNGNTAKYDLFIATIDSSTITGNVNIENFHSAFLIYPNPSDGEYIVKLKDPTEEIQNVKIHSVNGVCLRNLSGSRFSTQKVKLATLPGGEYIITLTTKRGNVFLGKIIRMNW